MSKIIYEPKCKAREFSPLAANLYSGCTHGCVYCYIPEPPWIDRKTFHEAVQPKKDALKLFEAKAKEIAANNDYRDREILLSLTCDPYPIIEAEQNITRQAIVILKKKTNYDLAFSLNPANVLQRILICLKAMRNAHSGPHSYLPTRKMQISGNPMLPHSRREMTR